ncbi:hypothetical protein CMUS01_11229, partial [Colletotrichum musicola]
MSDVRPASGARVSRRRRERPIVVCQECHRRKLKCNKQQPCDRCSKHSTPLKCTYAPDIEGRHRVLSENAHSHSRDEPDKAPSYISGAARLGSPPITPAMESPGPTADAYGSLPHARVMAWWHLIQAWQSVALRSDPYGIATLQTCCLVIFMRHIYNLDATASLHSSNALVRNAMIAGLHRDPALTDYLPSPDDLKLRQHLWYTILELDLQSSMDDGIQPS